MTNDNIFYKYRCNSCGNTAVFPSPVNANCPACLINRQFNKMVQIETMVGDKEVKTNIEAPPQMIVTMDVVNPEMEQAIVEQIKFLTETKIKIDPEIKWNVESEPFDLIDFNTIEPDSIVSVIHEVRGRWLVSKSTTDKSIYIVDEYDDEISLLIIRGADGKIFNRIKSIDVLPNISIPPEPEHPVIIEVNNKIYFNNIEKDLLGNFNKNYWAEIVVQNNLGRIIRFINETSPKFSWRKLNGLGVIKIIWEENKEPVFPKDSETKKEIEDSETKKEIEDTETKWEHCFEWKSKESNQVVRKYYRACFSCMTDVQNLGLNEYMSV